MIRAVIYGARDLRLEDTPLDPGNLAANEVYVETEISALSTGTDLGNYSGRSTELPGAPPYPRGVGYSNVGVIRSIGDSITHLEPGQKVFSLRPHQSAFIARGDELLVPVPASISSEQASLAYLAQLGMAAMRQANYQAGESVAVIGLGVIGLCTVALARAMGARVIAVGNSQLRLEAAVRLGAHSTRSSEEDASAEDIDLVVLTANPWAAFRYATGIARHGGRIATLGFPGREEGAPSFNPLDPAWFYRKQLTLLGSGHSPRTECTSAEIRWNLRRNLELIFTYMESGSVNLDSIITHRLPASRMREAYELAYVHSKDLMAAVFDWRSA
jgi:threonine dehydrogenase-like Zn-dependent dehydrogenase